MHRSDPRLFARRLASAAALAGLILVALGLLPLALGRLPQLRLIVDDPSANRSFAGFFAPEYNDTDVFRWSRPEAALFLFGFDGRPARLLLRLATFRPAGDPATQVAISMRGRPLGGFSVTPAWRRYYLLTPTDPAGDTALLLRSTVFRAADGRDLGVALSRMDAAPVAQFAPLPPPLRALFLGSLPLLGWLILLWHPRRAATVSFGGSAWRWAMVALLALVAGLAAVFPVAAGYYLPTVGWPWWPFLPILLVIAWPLLTRALGHVASIVDAAAAPAFWGGLGVALAAVVALRLGVSPAIGLVALVGGTATTLFALARPESVRAAPADDLNIQRSELIILVALTLAALALRFYRLNDVPAGLWRDEARHGLQALLIWNDPSYRPVYVVSGADLPALMFYLMAPVLAWLGPSPGAARMVSAFAGGLMPLALWWAARPLVGRRAALAGAALLAWASWGLSMSRWAFPATLDHVLELTAVGLMWRMLSPQALAGSDRRRPILGMALTGMLAGLAAYAYHTGRMAPLTLGILTMLRLGRDWRAWRAALPALFAAAIAGLLMLTPMLRFIADDFDGYNRRTAAVAVANSENLERHALLPLLLDNTTRYLLMWHVAGDPNGRHHAPNAPMVDPLFGTLLAFGVGLAILRWRRPAFAPLLWLGVALIPGIFSTDAPHAMRSLGALAPACMLAGMALDAVYHRLSDAAANRAARGRLPAVVAGGTLAASLIFNIILYFGVMPRDPAVYREFDLAGTAIGRAARAPAIASDPGIRAVRVFLDRRLMGGDVVRFLTYGLDIGSFNGVELSDPPGAQALLLLPANAADAERAAALAALGPTARELTPPRVPDGARALFLAYGVGDGAQRLLDETFQVSLW